LRQDHGNDALPGGADGHAQADFIGPLRHPIGDQPVNPDGGQQNGGCGEADEHADGRAEIGDGAGHYLFERLNRADGHIRILILRQSSHLARGAIGIGARFHQQGHGRWNVPVLLHGLRVWHIYGAWNPVGHGFAQAVLAHVAHHAHDRSPLLFTSAALICLPMGLSPGQKVPGRGRGNQQDRGGFGSIRCGEVAAGQQRNPQHANIAGADRAGPEHGRGVIDRLGMAFHIHRQVGLFGIQGNRACNRGVGDARDAARAFQKTVVECDTRRALRCKKTSSG
jgi:hypothetical protein